MSKYLRVAGRIARASERPGVTRSDQGKNQPPMSLIESFDSHRQAKHGRVRQQKAQHERSLPLGRTPVRKPGFGEEPHNKAQQRSQAHDAEISEKPHDAVMRNRSCRAAKSSESSAEEGITCEDLERIVDEVKPLLDLFRPPGHLLDNGQETISHQQNQAGSGNQSGQHRSNRNHGTNRAKK